MATDRKLKSDLARVAFVVLFFVAVAYVLHLPAVREWCNIQAFRSRVQDLPWSGRLLFLGIATALTAVGVPRLWISAAAGAVFGAFLGTILGHLASMLSATLNFYAVRLLLRGPVVRRMPARMHIWYERFNANGFRWLLYMRLFPLSNATLTNIMGGVSRMSYRDFFAATFIGYLPLTIVFSLFGSSAAKHNFLQLTIGAGIFAAVLIGRSLYEKRRGEIPEAPKPEELEEAASS